MVALAQEFRDVLARHTLVATIHALVRAGDAHDVACATNLATARRLLRQIDSEGFAR